MPSIPRGQDIWALPNWNSVFPGDIPRWIGDDSERLSGWLRGYGKDWGGFRIVSDPKGYEQTQKLAIRLGLSAEHVDIARNRIRIGHNILAAISKEQYMNRMREREGAWEERVQASEDEFMALGDQVPGVKPFKKEAAEMRDRAAHARREDRPFAGQVGGSRDTAKEGDD